ncbi:hypothetical protein GCM10009838_75900 [Catenulispora subtropica]|uniref:Uncharacterized protein n=1 Tax=Catenulispora subtropica TaxID=450798 RepID=A0ABN2T5M2_9ACTN
MSAYAAEPAGAASGAGATAAASKPPANAYFVGANGTVYGYGRTADGTWQSAAPVGAKMTAPPGAPVTSTRLPDGSPVAFFVGDDGAIWGGCGSLWRMTVAKLLRPGTPLTVVATPTVTMLLFSDGQGQWSGMHVESEIHHPCDIFTGPLAPLATESLPGTWHVPGGTIAATALPDGGVGVFAVDVTGAVHATWRDPDGKWSDTTLTTSGTSLPGGGIAATVSPADSSPTLFYSNRGGQVVAAPVAEGAGLRGDPTPVPWAVAKIPEGAALGAASSILGNDISYIAVGGTAVDLQTDAAGQWKNAVVLSPSGFAKDGRPVAVTASADEVDVYCGTATGIPGHFGVPPHTGGEVGWRAAGLAGMVPPLGGITAS